MTPQDLVPFIIPSFIFIFALTFLFLFRDPLANFLNGIKSVDIVWMGQTIKLTVKQAYEAANALLDETSKMISELSPKEKALFQKIVDADKHKHPITPDDLFGGEGKFLRRNKEEVSEQLKSLRKLRDAQLIRPKEGGQFRGDKELEIKEFGRVLLKTHINELFSEKEH